MAGQFIAANTAKEAAGLKNAKSAYLAGGTEDNRLYSSVTADTLISIRGIDELKKIESEDGFVLIGAMITFQEAIDCDLVPAYMKDACRFMGSRTKRNMATVAGNIAVGRDDSYLLATLIAANAAVKLMAGDGAECEIPVLEYINGKDKFADALIIAVKIPESIPFIASKRYANTVQSHAYLTVSVGGADLEHLTVAAAIKDSGIYSIYEAAAVIAGKPDITEEELIQWARDWKGAEIGSDWAAGEDYKRYLLGLTISLMLDDARKGGLK